MVGEKTMFFRWGLKIDGESGKWKKTKRRMLPEEGAQWKASVGWN